MDGFLPLLSLLLSSMDDDRRWMASTVDDLWNAGRCMSSRWSSSSEDLRLVIIAILTATDSTLAILQPLVTGDTTGTTKDRRNTTSLLNFSRQLLAPHSSSSASLIFRPQPYRLFHQSTPVVSLPTCDPGTRAALDRLDHLLFYF
nr:hypothetical protein CFP56_67362 [Quercus suber]